MRKQDLVWWAVLGSWKLSGKGRSHCPLKQRWNQCKSSSHLQELSRGGDYPITVLQGHILKSCLCSHFTFSRYCFTLLPSNSLCLAPAQKWGDALGNSYPQKSSGSRLFPISRQMFKHLSKNTGTIWQYSSQETSLTWEFQHLLFLEVPEILGAEGVLF